MKAYTDGACRVSNPGECSCAFAVYDGDTLVSLFSTYLGPELHTNNYAEYMGLLHLLRWASAKKITGLDIFCDSKLVVNQSNDVWNINKEELRPLRDEAYAFLVRDSHNLQHIKGHSGDPGNEYVDTLCNIELDVEFLRRENV